MSYATVNKEYSRHGGAYDRGSADRYYGRPFRPHYFVGSSYNSEEITEENMTSEEITAYTAGFEDETSRKDWGISDE